MDKNLNTLFFEMIKQNFNEAYIPNYSKIKNSFIFSNLGIYCCHFFYKKNIDTEDYIRNQLIKEFNLEIF